MPLLLRGRPTAPVRLSMLETRSRSATPASVARAGGSTALGHHPPAPVRPCSLGVLGLGLDHGVGGSKVETNEASRLVDEVLEDSAPGVGSSRERTRKCPRSSWRSTSGPASS